MYLSVIVRDRDLLMQSIMNVILTAFASRHLLLSCVSRCACLCACLLS